MLFRVNLECKAQWLRHGWFIWEKEQLESRNGKLDALESSAALSEASALEP